MLKKITKKHIESLSTEDLLLINSLFHEQKVPKKFRSRTEKLIDMGIIETAMHFYTP